MANRTVSIKTASHTTRAWSERGSLSICPTKIAPKEPALDTDLWEMKYKAIHNSDVWPYSLRISRLIRAKCRRLEHSVHVCPVAGDIIAVRNRKRFCLRLILSICLGFEYDFFSSHQLTRLETYCKTNNNVETNVNLNEQSAGKKTGAATTCS